MLDARLFGGVCRVCAPLLWWSTFGTCVACLCVCLVCVNGKYGCVLCVRVCAFEMKRGVYRCVCFCAGAGREDELQHGIQRDLRDRHAKAGTAAARSKLALELRRCLVGS